MISVALLPFSGEGAIQIAQYAEKLFGRGYVHLEYWEIRLRDLPASEYLLATPILGPTLASLMRTAAGGKPDLKLAIIERLRTSGLDEARLFLAVNFMETYLQLNVEEQAAYLTRIQAEGGQNVKLSELTWADKLLVRGREEGREEGELLARRAIVQRQAQAKFGGLPEEVTARLSAADSDTLDRLLDRVVRVATLDQFLDGFDGT